MNEKRDKRKTKEVLPDFDFKGQGHNDDRQSLIGVQFSCEQVIFHF